MPLTVAQTRQYGDLRAKQATGPLTNADAQKLEKLSVSLSKPKKRKRTSTLALGKAGDAASKKQSAVSPTKEPTKRKAATKTSPKKRG